MTPHINSKKNDIAKIVIMPGDPKRAEWISNNFLTEVKLVNDIRGMLAFTGYYKNKKITIMGHGMGIPSIGIYSYELYNFYDVDIIIRIGSAGSYVDDINLGDFVIVNEAYSNSNYADDLGIKVIDNTLKPTAKLYEKAIKFARDNNYEIKQVRCYSSDTFYSKYDVSKIKNITNAQVVEMEAFGLFANAIKLNKSALCLLTCSDSLVKNEELSAIERQTGFKKMIEYALEFAKEC